MQFNTTGATAIRRYTHAHCRARFADYCRELTNVTPIEYLLICRVEAACRAVRRETGRSNSNIGFACGFKSNQYFTSMFRRQTGLSPSECRRRDANAAGC